MIRGVITRRPLDLLFPLECSGSLPEANDDSLRNIQEADDIGDNLSDKANDHEDPFDERNDDIPIVRTKYGRTIKPKTTKDYQYY
jgi:hypothetical protein